MRIACLLPILFFQMVLFSDIELGNGFSGHSLYLRSDGSLWGTGRNNLGQLMHHSNPNVYAPVELVTGNVIHMSAGQYFTVYVKDDGSAWGVGDNGNGQFGSGNTFSTTVPYQIFSGNVVEVVAGYNWAAYRLNDGSLWTSGYNLNGQLGTGNTIQHETPVMIEASGVVELAAGEAHLIYRKSDNSVWGTGKNDFGQLGEGTLTDQNTPVQIFSDNIVAIAAGRSHSLFLSGNLLYASGLNTNAQLGDETTSNQSTVIYTGQANISTIYAGANKSGWTNTDGETYVVGENANSEYGDATSPMQTPHLLVSFTVNDLALGQDHILLEYTDGVVKGRGLNVDGQLGSADSPHSNLINANYPESYGAANKIVAKYKYSDFHISQGMEITFIIQDLQGRRIENDNQTNITLTPSSSANISRVLVGLGDGSYGVDATAETIQARRGVVSVWVSNDQLENFTITVSNDAALTDPSVISLQATNDVSAIKLEAKEFSSFVLYHDGTLRGSGQNTNYELADNSALNQQDPIEMFSGNILDVAAGQNHTLMVTHNNELWGVGDNSYDQFGATGFGSHSSPVRIVAGNVASAASAFFSTYYLLNNGELYGLGENTYGQLGDGSTSNSSTPILISSNVVDFDAGSYHLVYIKGDGSLWGVGQNTDGQLGDGTSLDKTSPIQIMGGNVTRVFCAGQSTFVSLNNGELWGFGRNDYGQLGINHNGNQLTPAFISNRMIIDVAGDTHSMLLNLEGDLYVTGRNLDGQLGNGTTTDINYLQLQHQDIVAMAAGQSHTLINQSGEILGTGSNNYGELGNDTLGAGSFNTVQDSNFDNMIGRAVKVALASAPDSLGVDQQGELVFEIQDEYGNVIETDNTTSITVTPSGNGQIFGVSVGFGDGSYGVNGAAETIMLLNGEASVIVSDDTIESLNITITNDAGLENPAAVSIAITSETFIGKVAAGQDFSLFLHGNGDLYGAGKNSSYGQLGDSDLLDKHTPVLIASDVSDISAGLTSSYFVKNDGSLWGMGRGFYGELGRGMTSDEYTPVQIVSGSVDRVEAGKNYVLILKDNGSVYGVGRNDFGQLGDGTVTDQSSFQQVFASGILDFSAGSTHSLFLKSDGSAWAVGENNYGQLGDGTTTNTSTPVMVSGFSANIIAVSAGSSHSVFLKNDGSLWVTGYNTYGQLGDGTNSAKSSPVQVVGGNVIAVYAAYQSTFFKKNDGSLWAMGQGVNGEFGNGTSSDSNVPVQVMASGLYSMDSNYSHSLFLLTDGSVEASGSEDFGEFAVDYSGARMVSTRIQTDFLPSNTITVLPASYSVTTQSTTFNPAQGTLVTLKVLDSNGDIISTENTLEFTLSVNANAYIHSVTKGQGDGSYGGATETITARNGQVSFTLKDATVETFDLSISNNRSVSGQTSIQFATDTNASNPKVAAGRSSSFYLTNQGALYASGLNDFGQLGDGTITNRQDPVEIYASGVMDVASGYSHTLILKTNGSVWAAGQNTNGQLGDGTTTQRNTPVQVFAANVIAVWAGDYHSLFLMNNNELWGAGRNDFGQLGEGSNTDQSTPVMIASDVLMASAGEHSLMVKSDGSLWGTGYNFHGQLGDGTTTHQASWIQILASGVESCFAGQNHSFFIKSDGSLWGMGRGDYGQLGDGTSTNSNTPVEILESGASQLVGGFNHSLLVKDDGSLWSFGDGASGQLGNGSVSSENVPYQVEASGVSSIGAGESISIYLKNGRFYFMGYNAYGSLGDQDQGNTTFNTPVTSNFPDLTGNPTEVVVMRVPAHLGVNQRGLVKVEVIDNFGGTALNDNSTNITFSLSGNGKIFGVQDGIGDGSYEVLGGSETVQVIEGVASVLVSDDTVETLTVSFSNDAGLLDPGSEDIEITATPAVGKIDVGSHTTLYLSAEARLYGAGRNSDGQLADSGFADQRIPVSLSDSDIIDMSIGHSTVYYVKDEGSLWGLGRGTEGQLGGAMNSSHHTPQVMESESVLRVEAGVNFVLYLKDDGSLWGAGQNTNGQLGDGSNTDVNTKTQIFTSGIIDFAAGGSHSLFVKDDGSAWSTGYNFYGQLGDTTTTNSSSPVQVNGMSSNVSAVAAGENHSLFLMDDGSVYGVGQNGSGQLGLGNTTDQSAPVLVFSANVSKIFAGSYNSFFLMNDGSLWATGQGINGEFGDGSASDINTAIQVLASGVVSVASWENITLFLMDDGSVLGSGHETNGEMALDTVGSAYHYNRTPTGYVHPPVIPLAANNYTIKIKNSTFHPTQGTMVTIRVLDSAGNIITTENTLEFTFSSNMSSYIERVVNGQGDGSYGVLGGTETITVRDGRIRFVINDQVNESFVLTVSNNRSVSGPGSKTLTADSLSAEPSVAAGFNSSFYVSATGELWAAGLNDFYQLGDGSGVDQQDPVLIYGGNVLDVASGSSHTLILKSDGSVEAVGSNSYGQLGDGSTIDRSTPVQVFAANVVAIWAGESHSLFLLNNDELWGVGKNTTGELGDGSNLDQSTPILISADVVDAAAGSHTLYVKKNGSLWATGVNNSGQLGDGSITSRSTPVRIESTGVASVFAGSSTSFYIKDDGSLWAMGEGAMGQLGDGSSTQQQTPVQVLASGVSDLAAGLSHTLIIKDDDSLWSFGDGANGRLGHGNTFSLALPTMLESGNVSSIATGDQFSLFIKDELVYFMGYNFYGQAADSNLGSVDVLSPVLTNFTGNAMMPVAGGNAFMLQQTVFTPPGTLNRGSVNVLTLDWELVGGDNLETLDSITLKILGDINDIKRFEILDVTAGSNSIYSGNAMNGDVVAGNVFFTGSPQTVLSNETRHYQLMVSVFESTSQDNIEITLNPENLGLAGGNLAVGNVITSGMINFTGTPAGNASSNVTGLDDASIAMGPAQSYLLDDGVLVTRGGDSFGELARSGDANIFLPTNLSNIISLAAGENHAVALGGNGEVYTWGSNLLDQSNASGQPELVTGLGNAIWVGAGAYSSYVLNESGQLFSTGRNHKGQSGQGFVSATTSWSMVSLPSGNLEKIDAGIEHVLMIIDGSLYGFGSNGFGQLTVNNATAPTLIDNSEVWVDIAAGGFHSLAMSGNGSVFSWGKNSHGQCGLGFDSAIVSDMSMLNGISNIVELSAGYAHSIFLEDVASFRTIYSCGSDQFGQTGHVGPTNVPTVLSGEPSIDEVQAGPHSTIFKHSGQFIKLMGLDSDGSQTVTPVQIFDTGI